MRGTKNRPGVRPAEPTGSTARDNFRLKNHVATLALLVTFLGAAWTGADWGKRYWGEILRVQRLESTLISVAARQRKFSQQNDAYAGSLKELKARFLPEDQARIRIATGWLHGKPSYFAEFCDNVSCRGLDAAGPMRSGSSMALRPVGPELPSLKEGKGRFFAQLSKSGKVEP